jgi:hypothetical protein
MNKHELAAILNGRQIYKEITREEELAAKEAGLVIVFGHGDDNAEFRGAIHDEVSCFNGTTIYLNKDGLFEDCEYAENFRDGCKHNNCAKAQCKTIEAVWCEKNTDFAWTYKTDMPHVTFEVMEDGEPFCRGIVFDIKDL